MSPRSFDSSGPGWRADSVCPRATGRSGRDAPPTSAVPSAARNPRREARCAASRARDSIHRSKRFIGSSGAGRVAASGCTSSEQCLRSRAIDEQQVRRCVEGIQNADTCDNREQIQWVESTRSPRARASSTAARQSVDLPIPASPSRAIAIGPSPTARRSRTADSALSSSSLPTTSTAIRATIVTRRVPEVSPLVGLRRRRPRRRRWVSRRRSSGTRRGRAPGRRRRARRGAGAQRRRSGRG